MTYTLKDKDDDDDGAEKCPLPPKPLLTQLPPPPRDVQPACGGHLNLPLRQI
jgi:hypothetical protein